MTKDIEKYRLLKEKRERLRSQISCYLPKLKEDNKRCFELIDEMVDNEIEQIENLKTIK